MSAGVSASGVSKAYRDGARVVGVLRNIEVEIPPGELVAIVGPSGSGKSTLLYLLGGLDRPDSGRIAVAGRELGTLGAAELAAFRNRTVGFVFQFHQLLPDFTALENVMIPGKIAGLPAATNVAAALELLTEVGLADRLDHFPSQLSGGECQRVALCRALLLKPPLLLADEPTGNLDPESGETVFRLLIDLQRRHGSTAVVVTHNPELAKRCAKIFRLENGELKPER